MLWCGGYPNASYRRVGGGWCTLYECLLDASVHTDACVTLLTGQYPWRHGWINHWDVPRWGAGCHCDPGENLTFARLLREAGYATAAAGKWQINDFRVQPDAMKEHGFDEWCMWTGYETGNPPSAERYWNPYINTRAGSRSYTGQFGPDVFADFLIDFMKRHREQPQLLYFPMVLTHGPFTTTPAEPEAEGDLEKHKAMVRYMDDIVGRLVAALDALNLREETIVIFTADNGSGGSLVGRRHGRPFHGGKATLGENGVCEPFIVNGPGRVPAGLVTDALTDFTDLFPTLVDLAGATPPKESVIDGRTLAPLLLGKEQDSPREWILAMGAHPAKLTERGVEPVAKYADRAIRDKRYKLWVLDGKPARLHDLKTDPAEEVNLIASTEQDAIAARERLVTFLQAFPEQDGRPRYTPTPAQPWDVKPPGP